MNFSFNGPIVLFVLLLLGACRGCDSSSENQDKIKIDGLYEYVYEHNTDEFKENHYIHFETKNDEITGTYYGTSDDFDQAREGYFPGFFKAEIRDLTINDGFFEFKVSVKDDDFYSSPILPGQSTDNLEKWPQKIGGGEKVYRGKWSPDKLEVESEGLDPRTFTKKQ